MKAFSDEHNVLVTGGEDMTLRVWKYMTGEVCPFIKPISRLKMCDEARGRH